MNKIYQVVMPSRQQIVEAVEKGWAFYKNKKIPPKLKETLVNCIQDLLNCTEQKAITFALPDRETFLRDTAIEIADLLYNEYFFSAKLITQKDKK